MSNNWTAETLLALSDDELGKVAAEALVPKPWRHGWLDLETAMELFRKSHECFGHLREIYFIVCQEAVNRPTFPWWILYHAQPRHYLIAAILAAQATEIIVKEI